MFCGFTVKILRWPVSLALWFNHTELDSRSICSSQFFKPATLPEIIIIIIIYISSSHVWIWELDHKEGWVPKNWCFQIVVLEKALKSPLDCKEITPVHPKGDQSWIFIGRTDAEAEAPILWHLMLRINSLEKALMLGKVEGGRGRGRQRMRWLDGTTDSMDMSLPSSRRWWRTGEPGVLWPVGLQRVRHDFATEQEQNNTACGILVPSARMEPAPLQWKYRVLTPGPSGMSAYQKLLLPGPHFQVFCVSSRHAHSSVLVIQPLLPETTRCGEKAVPLSVLCWEAGAYLPVSL